jgi:L-alanine-DL-glutamate epimerase-like enolase superfamily enzyme
VALATSAGGLALAGAGFQGCASRAPLASPDRPLGIDLRRRFPAPVVIDSIRVVRAAEHVFVRATSADGAVGTTVANDNLSYLLPILEELVVPFFVGKDARDLEALVDEIYYHGRTYKLAGVALWNCVGHVEVALLDLLGQLANLPAGALLGPVLRREIPVYLSSLRRDTTPEQEVEWLAARLAETGARAVKLKIGGRMSRNADASPGRTDRLIPLSRSTFGDGVEIFVDANGSYDAGHAIAVGRMLGRHRVGFYEEPCPWQEYEATRQVADALDVPVAGGEQDSSLPQFDWMIRNRVLDLVQPDLLYNGGLLRCLRVARMAERAGMAITPHSPKADPLAACMLQFASIVPNLGSHQEFAGRARRPESWFEPRFEARDGRLAVPAGPGLGVRYDPALWSAAAKL